MKSVQPGLCSFIDPTACLGAWAPTLFTRFVASRLDVPSIVATFQAASKGFRVVRFVGAHVLRLPSSWLWSVNRYTVERRHGQLEVVAIGGPDPQAQDNAARVGQHRTLDAQLAAIGGIWPGFFPLPAVPWSLPCRAFANASQCRDDDHIQSAPASTICGTPHDHTTTENNGAGCCPSRTLWARPSKGSPSSSHSRCRWQHGVVPTADAHHGDAAVVWATACAAVARARRASLGRNLQ